MLHKHCSSFVPAIALVLICGSGFELLAQRTRTSKKSVPPAVPSAANAPVQTGEPIGKRIIFSDGGTLDIDDSWQLGDTIWYRLNGTSQSTDRKVRVIENRYKETAANTQLESVVSSTPAKAPAVPLATWIYLAGGARLRVEEVREVADGAWYKRGNLTVFLARDRITRIEREQPAEPSGAWREHGWSSGSASIDQLIRENATRFKIDPYLVFLVIEQESHFRPRAVSPKGARGLMQLMPGTARRFGVARPFEPADNIRGGTKYLKQLLTMFGGRVDLALASYNAGEGRVLDYGNRVPPFKETREYVRRISSRYRNHMAPATAEIKGHRR